VTWTDDGSVGTPLQGPRLSPFTREGFTARDDEHSDFCFLGNLRQWLLRRICTVLSSSSPELSLKRQRKGELLPRRTVFIDFVDICRIFTAFSL
jgi:hypothetical protein